MNNSQVVIVTGASRGLGAAVACWLGKAALAVTLIARSEENLNETGDKVRRLGGKPLVCRADVSQYDACRKAVDKTLDRFGRIDAVVNNAAVVQPICAVARTDPADWRYNLEVNLLGPFNLIRASADALRRQKGRVVNVSSGAANSALGSMSAYCSGKAALNHFTRVLAVEEPELTALTVRPGVVDTDMQTYIRQEGSQAMPSDQADFYQQLKDRGELEPATIPARSIAWLGLYAPREFSGKFLNYDDPLISEPALKVFGERVTD